MIIRPQNKGEDPSTCRKSVNVLVRFRFPHPIFCKHLTVPNSVNYFCEKFMILFEWIFVCAIALHLLTNSLTPQLKSSLLSNHSCTVYL